MESLQKCIKARTFKEKRALKRWLYSGLQGPQLLAAHASIFPSCHGSSDVNWRWRQACHFLEQRNTRGMTPFPWLPQPGWDESSWAGTHWNEVLESPHLAYICGLRSFDFWLMASSTQRLDCSEGSGLFFSTQDWRRWPQLGLLFADAASAPQGLETGRRCAQPTQWGHQALIDHSSSYCQKRFYIKLFSWCPPHFDLRQLWCSNNWTDFIESNCCVGLRPSSIALVHSTSSDPFFPVFSAVHCRADNWVQLQVKLFAWQWANQSWIGSEQAVFP